MQGDALQSRDLDAPLHLELVAATRAERGAVGREPERLAEPVCQRNTVLVARDHAQWTVGGYLTRIAFEVAVEHDVRGVIVTHERLGELGGEMIATLCVNRTKSAFAQLRGKHASSRICVDDTNASGV